MLNSVFSVLHCLPDATACLGIQGVKYYGKHLAGGTLKLSQEQPSKQANQAPCLRERVKDGVGVVQRACVRCRAQSTTAPTSRPSR